ncbi:hypothetical protein GCM10009603_60130 [Nocardiopsis exhalans]
MRLAVEEANKTVIENSGLRNNSGVLFLVAAPIARKGVRERAVRASERGASRRSGRSGRSAGNKSYGRSLDVRGQSDAA